jgi:predicted butyrate kinase (DUF1464 family)
MDAPARTPAPTTTADKIMATLSWIVCLVGLTVSFMSIFLAFQIGPWDSFALAMIVGAMVCGLAGALGFWRYSHVMGGRPAVAFVLLFVAIIWAGLAGGMTGLLIAAFS